jgi:hypothetical protein
MGQGHPRRRPARQQVEGNRGDPETAGGAGEHGERKRDRADLHEGQRRVFDVVDLDTRSERGIGQPRCADPQICATDRRVERDLRRAPVVPSTTPAATAPVRGNPRNY